MKWNTQAARSVTKARTSITLSWKRKCRKWVWFFIFYFFGLYTYEKRRHSIKQPGNYKCTFQQIENFFCCFMLLCRHTYVRTHTQTLIWLNEMKNVLLLLSLCLFAHLVWLHISLLQRSEQVAAMVSAAAKKLEAPFWVFTKTDATSFRCRVGTLDPLITET